MKTIDEQPQTLTKDLRANLKTLVEIELNQLPETLAALPADKRLEVLLKLLPFVLPKVESVAMTKGEPTSWELD
jgi:hypothetical protein